MSILWLETVKQNYNHFFSEIQLIEGVCVAKKENRTFSPKVGFILSFNIILSQKLQLVVKATLQLQMSVCRSVTNQNLQ